MTLDEPRFGRDRYRFFWPIVLVFAVAFAIALGYLLVTRPAPAPTTPRSVYGQPVGTVRVFRIPDGRTQTRLCVEVVTAKGVALSCG